jgi:hypothetical protein
MVFGNTTTTTSLAQIFFSHSSTKMVLGDNNGTVVAAGSTATTSAIYHLVGTYDGTNARFYVNGALSGGPTAHAWNIALTSGAVQVANDMQGDYWASVVDECAFYSTTLSATQVANHYAAGIMTSLSDGGYGGMFL